MVREPFNALSHALGVPLALLGGLLLLLLAPREAWPTLPTLALMALSGPSYTLGAWVYGTKRPNPWPGRVGFHGVWHVLVLLGSLFMYLAVLSLYT
ncbi:hypothetical protein TthAK1_16050 [Thermus thermophilus]|uniref:hemolysin III family protein n=1 Tax=Thermus thermophilus TaxID=274 RepID=UPI001C789091|nr:hemolysin III family protein [Thermus thermophilus]BCZ94988.1 hypothetical protein TthAK1_16050 [Thermus thermophilus]